MINFGKVRPGRTIYIPFETFASSTGAPITMTGFAVGDIKIYKDGNTTERASTSGFTLLDTDGIDFDGITGIHGFSVDLSDNATADFYASGSRYFIIVSTVTVDGQTMSFVAATFMIGYESSILDTTIATLSSQTSFTLATGPAEDDALNGMWACIHDAASAIQHTQVLILDYTGSTKTVTLAAAGTFTVAVKDNISVMNMAPMQPTVLGRTLDVSSGGEAGVDWANVGSPTTAQNLSATNIDVDQIVASVSGAVGSVTGLTASNLDATISSRASQASLDTLDDFVDTEVAAIKAKTDNLPSDPADASDIAASFTTVNTKLDTIDDFLDTEVAAIKAKTDNLPTDPADASDIAASFTTVNTKLDTIDDFIDTEVSAIKAKTDNLPADPADASDIAASFASLSTLLTTIAGYIDTEILAIKAKTDNLPSDPADQSAVEAAILAAFTTALTESYRTAGATGSPAQLLYEILAHLGEMSISGTTKTLKKLDGSTTAKTYTLNSSTAPTAITETT